MRVEGEAIPKAVEGELIAATDAEVVVRAGGKLVRVDTGDIERVVVNVLPETRTVGGVWTAVGAVSSASHGAYAVFSLPAWILAGTLATVSLARDERWAFPGAAPELHEYARFPQGLPPSWTSATEAGVCPRFERDAGAPSR